MADPSTLDSANSFSPPVFNVNHIAIGIGTHELLLSVGQSRMVFSRGKNSD